MCHSLEEIIAYAHRIPEPPAAIMCAAQTKRSHHCNGDTASLAANERAGPTSPAAPQTERPYSAPIATIATCFYLVTQDNREDRNW